MELVFLGKADTDGLNSAKLAAYLPCLPQASIGRIDSRDGIKLPLRHIPPILET